jgi:hypothetical protein
MATRRIAFAGILGCSTVVVYLVYSTNQTREELGVGETIQPVGSHTRPSQVELSNATIPSNSLPEESCDVVPIAAQKKNVGRKIKDALDRRMYQHKFPFNGWWRRRGLSPKEESLYKSGTSKSAIPSTADLAIQFTGVVQDVKLLAEKLVKQQGESKLAKRFDDLEIARYALHYGLLRIEDGNDLQSEGRRVVVQDAAEGVANSHLWFKRHTFASIELIHQKEYSDLIWWKYTQGKDPRPVLHVNIGKAVKSCTDKVKQKEFANIVLTMMELASLNSPLTGIEIPSGGIDRIDVEIYAGGTNTMNATSAFWILRAVVKTVSHHYPGRLNTLVLHDLPILLNWVVIGVKKLVHPDTAKKIYVTK